ncbi:Protein of unknown function [Bacillus cereus]|uniref:Uncharacterized protein n=1 Tax=Bacillus wiedmannii TaxID=1890302 RepID=A0AB37YZA0_9BACI|nr:Protein of unknown function [Bacillus wiedmannii]SCC65990.1 Protein of unknown function [Bacillus cereus]
MIVSGYENSMIAALAK